MVLPKFDDIPLKGTNLLNFYDPEMIVVKMKLKHENNLMSLEKTYKDNQSRLSFGTRIPIDNRVELQNKWNSDNIFFQEIAIKNYISGTRFGITKSFAPNQGKFNTAGTLLYSQGRIRTDISLFKQNDKLQYNAQTVLGLNNHWLIGSKFTGEPFQDKLLTYAGTLAYHEDKFQMVATARNDKIELFLYQRVCSTSDFVVCNKFDGNSLLCEIAISHDLNDVTRLFGKVDGNASLWLGLQKRINSFISVKLFGEWSQKKHTFSRIAFGFDVDC